MFGVMLVISFDVFSLFWFLEVMTASLKQAKVKSYDTLSDILIVSQCDMIL